MPAPWRSAALSLFTLCATAGCFSRAALPVPESAPELPSPGVAAAADVFELSAEGATAKTRVILLAGSAQNANFAQEILDLREIWLDAGVPSDAIACYYVPPGQRTYEQDQQQWDTLAPALASCQLATVPSLREALRVAAPAQPQPGDEPLFIYLTSHGTPPISMLPGRSRTGEPRYMPLRRRSPYKALDTHQVQVESLDGHPADPQAKVDALLWGADPDELFLTPANLRAMLDGWSEARKVLVIQACFSGGFIDEPRDPQGERNLSGLRHVTVLTAARHDRSSFGCGTDELRTFFGGVLLDVLQEQPGTPGQVDWPAVFEETAARVQTLELEQGESPPSEPRIYIDP